MMSYRQYLQWIPKRSLSLLLERKGARDVRIRGRFSEFRLRRVKVKIRIAVREGTPLNFYASFTSRRQKFGEDFVSFGSDLERLCRMAYPEGMPYDRVRASFAKTTRLQFISGLVDNYVKGTLRLVVNSLKAAVVRARAIKEIQEEWFDKRRRNLKFARRNLGSVVNPARYIDEPRKSAGEPIEVVDRLPKRC